MEKHEGPAHDAARIARRFFDEVSTPWDIAGGTFVTKDGTILTIGLDSSDREIGNWETYEGFPFPANIRVTQHVRLPEAGLEDEDDLTINYKLRIRNGSPECVSVCVESPTSREVRAKDLDRIRIDDVLEAALLQLSLWKRSATTRQRGEAVGALMRRRRAGSDEVLRDVARVYEENIEGAPTQAVSDYFGISKSAADKRVKRARDAGYITKTAKAGRRPQRHGND